MYGEFLDGLTVIPTNVNTLKADYARLILDAHTWVNQIVKSQVHSHALSGMHGCLVSLPTSLSPKLLNKICVILRSYGYKVEIKDQRETAYLPSYGYRLDISWK